MDNTRLAQAKYTQVNAINISVASSVRIYIKKLNLDDLNSFGSVSVSSSVPILLSLTVE